MKNDVVWKFPFEGRTMRIEGYRFTPLHVGLDIAEQVCIWARIHGEDIEAPARTFSIYPTGSEVPPQAIHLGSLNQMGFIWHIFEEIA